MLVLWHLKLVPLKHLQLKIGSVNQGKMLKAVTCVVTLLCAASAAEAVRYITIGARTTNTNRWTRPWFCHDLECPPFKNSTRDEDYEVRKYEPGSPLGTDTLSICLLPSMYSTRRHATNTRFTCLLCCKYACRQSTLIPTQHNLGRCFVSSCGCIKALTCGSALKAL